MIEKSPSGKSVVPSVGPVDAKIIMIGESPAADEVTQGIPFIGRAGKLLNGALRHVGLDRAKIRLMNLVPVRAPGDKFAAHVPADVEWARARFTAELASLTNDSPVFVALGANPTEWLLGVKPPVANYGTRDKEGFISEWRGSAIPVNQFRDRLAEPRPEDYLQRLDFFNDIELPYTAVVVPTFHPAAVLRQYTWHPWLVADLRRAASISTNGLPPVKYRNWFINDPSALDRLANDPPDILALDSEIDPPIVGIVTEDEVHAFEYTDAYHDAMSALLTSDRVIKVAHNWPHDYADMRIRKGITVKRPMFDTQGGAHDTNTALQKELSPHIATRFTNWPYHKWLVNHDPVIYCGMDAVVCWDAYWPIMTEAMNRGLYYAARLNGMQMSVLEYDHKLQAALMEMQAVGFKIDEAARQEVEVELENELSAQTVALQQMVQPVIDAQIDKFEKPHLFRVKRKCSCCGGGATQRAHCEHCTLDGKTICWNGESVDYKTTGAYYGFKTIKAFKASFTPCKVCNATGKIDVALEFNPDSPDQLADVIYRGLKIRPRRFKGNETTKAAQLDPIKDRNPIIAKVVETSETRADYDTVRRLTAGTDGLLHCVFDPFGTGSGRVAGKEGLLEQGTNPMNLPKSARRFVVPRPGKIFLYPDMAQIEARVVAALSKDKNLISAFNTPIDWPGNPKHGKIDSHTRVVQLMAAAGVTITRDQAKRLTYAVIYGGGAKQLAVELNAEAFRKGDSHRLTAADVQIMIDVFYRVFNGIKQWQQDVVSEVERTRKLRNPLTGREFTWLGYIIETRKRAPEYGELKYEIRKQVWSRLPQDTAAYVLGLGLIDLYESDHWGSLLQPLIHVHDALLMEAPIERVEEAKTVALSALTRYIWGMNFPAEMKVGANWLECS